MTKGISPTQRSLRYLREQGFLVEKTEHWNQHVRIRQDLFGIADMIALTPTETWFIQSTTGDNAAARLAKICGNPKASEILTSPHRKIFIHAWRKVGARGKRKLWELREIEVALETGNGTAEGNATHDSPAPSH